MTDSPPLKVLLVEDDEPLARLTARYLDGHGLSVVRAASGTEAVRVGGRGGFDAVLLDLNLPGLDGIAVCRELRQRSDVPIIILTARAEEADRVVGLDVGADDYVCKPFSARELLSRIHAVVRRARGQVGPAGRTLRVGALVLDPARFHVTIGDTAVEVTSYEFALLRALAERSGRVLSREQLLELAPGGGEDALDRSIDVHISRLRQKLGERGRRLLRTVRGAGYMLAPPEDGP